MLISRFQHSQSIHQCLARYGYEDVEIRGGVIHTYVYENLSFPLGGSSTRRPIIGLSMGRT